MTTRNTDMRAQLQKIPFSTQQGEKRMVPLPRLMPIADMRKAFVNEWVVSNVTTWDKTETPIRGEVLKHHAHKSVVYQAAKNYLAQHPTAHLFIFFAGDPIPIETDTTTLTATLILRPPIPSTK